MKKIIECYKCGSEDLKWNCSQKNLIGVADGRLRLHEVGTDFYLACAFCNETLQVVDGDKVAEFLNNSMKD
ncbi:MAG: hypothetical protein PHE38_14350 [Alishewanella agri]|nr:hypothetical protein [Alishewanella agri]